MHVNEPGRTEWEGFASVTAAAGGVTTIVDMPLNSLPPTTAPDEEFVVDATGLRHRHPVTPYDGARLPGVVHRTWPRGGEPTGILLSRERNA